MAESAPGEVIVLHLNNELRSQRLPLLATTRAPAALSAGTASRKPRWFDQGSYDLRDPLTFVLFETGCEANVVKQTGFVIQSQQK